MEINSRLHYSLLRNPLFIAGFLLISFIPEVVFYCTNLGTDNPLGSCGREVVKASFVQSSFLSSSIVFLAFESQRWYLRSKLINVPANFGHWLKAHSEMLLISMMTFIAFVILTTGIHWLSGDVLDMENILEPSSMLKILLIVFLSFYCLAIYSEFKSKTDPLNKELNLGVDLKKRIPLGSIRYFIKKDRGYSLCTRDGSLISIKLTLQEIEQKVPDKCFARVNRSTIVNITDIQSYNHWEHEKYILKMHSGEEFVITRKRLNALKSLL